MVACKGRIGKHWERLAGFGIKPFFGEELNLEGGSEEARDRHTGQQTSHVQVPSEEQEGTEQEGTSNSYQLSGYQQFLSTVAESRTDDRTYETV